jgi:hypothetical protein
MFSGRIVGIYTAPAAGVPMVGHDDVRAIAGVGLDGDRYATGAGRYSDRGDRRDVTLIEREAIVGAGVEYELELAEHETRRNLITEGVPLNTSSARRSVSATWCWVASGSRSRARTSPAWPSAPASPAHCCIVEACARK